MNITKWNLYILGSLQAIIVLPKCRIVYLKHAQLKVSLLLTLESNLKCKDQVWCTPIIPTFRRMRQDSEFHASLGYTVSSRPTKATKGSYYHKLINTTPPHTPHMCALSFSLSVCLSLSWPLLCRQVFTPVKTTILIWFVVYIHSADFPPCLPFSIDLASVCSVVSQCHLLLPLGFYFLLASCVTGSQWVTVHSN